MRNSKSSIEFTKVQLRTSKDNYQIVEYIAEVILKLLRNEPHILSPSSLIFSGRGNNNNINNNKSIKATLDRTQQNSRWRLCGDRADTINHIISECSKLALSGYKSRHDWEGKVIYGELCKKFKFDHMNKWYMHNPESVQKNETNKILWDFEIQTDHLISARQPDLWIFYKKKGNPPNSELCSSG